MVIRPVLFQKKRGVYVLEKKIADTNGTQGEVERRGESRGSLASSC